MHRKPSLMRFLRAVALRGTLFVLAAAAAASAPAVAAENPPVYAGKTVRVLVGYGPGGGYDIYARELGRFLGRHIPGNPAVVVQNMVGAGSLKAVNYLFNAAPRDGTTIATFARGIGRRRGRNAAQQGERRTWRDGC